MVPTTMYRLDRHRLEYVRRLGVETGNEITEPTERAWDRKRGRRHHQDGVIPSNPADGPAPASPTPIGSSTGRPAASHRSWSEVEPSGKYSRLSTRARPSGLTVGQEHSGLAVGHLAQSGTALKGHSNGLPALLGKVAAVHHPHRLWMFKPASQGLLKTLYDCVVIPRVFGEKPLHRPSVYPYRLGQILGVARLAGLHQQGLEITATVAPRLPAPKQRSKVSVKNPEKPRTPARKPPHPLPYLTCQAFLNYPVILLCHPSLCY